jgi:hypothetical protein
VASKRSSLRDWDCKGLVGGQIWRQPHQGLEEEFVKIGGVSKRTHGV